VEGGDTDVVKAAVAVEELAGRFEEMKDDFDVCKQSLEVNTHTSTSIGASSQPEPTILST
jgi:hypothetical protein